MQESEQGRLSQPQQEKSLSSLRLSKSTQDILSAFDKKRSESGDDRTFEEWLRDTLLTNSVRFTSKETRIPITTLHRIRRNLGIHAFSQVEATRRELDTRWQDEGFKKRQADAARKNWEKS